MSKLPENYPPVINLTHDDYESGIFEVGQTIEPFEYNSQELVEWSNIIRLYMGDQSKGSALFGIGVIKKIISDGGQAVLIYRTGDTPVYPEMPYEDDTPDYW